MAETKKNTLSKEDEQILLAFSLIGKRAQEGSDAISESYGSAGSMGALCVISDALDSLVNLGCEMNEDNFADISNILSKSNEIDARPLLKTIFLATRFIYELEAYRNVLIQFKDINTALGASDFCKMFITPNKI